jgi:hypothetical protein
VTQYRLAFRFANLLDSTPKISELPTIQERSCTTESELQIFAVRKANKFLFVLSAMPRSVTPLCQKVIFRAVHISLFECGDETEFIPLCGVRGRGTGDQYTADKEGSSNAGQ